MQASELFQIVKDVPAQAGPDGLSLWTDVDKRCPDAWIVDSEIGVHQVSTHHAALMFVGSMTAWLLSRHELDLRPEANEGLVTHLSIKCDFGEWVGGNSIVAALAAACKEVSNG
jgi:hypothetical protein